MVKKSHFRVIKIIRFVSLFIIIIIIYLFIISHRLLLQQLVGTGCGFEDVNVAQRP